jgi:hypothetical protein
MDTVRHTGCSGNRAPSELMLVKFASLVPETGVPEDMDAALGGGGGAVSLM